MAANRPSISIVLERVGTSSVSKISVIRAHRLQEIARQIGILYPRLATARDPESGENLRPTGRTCRNYATNSDIEVINKALQGINLKIILAHTESVSTFRHSAFYVPIV